MTTEYHATYYAHELSRRHSIHDREKLAAALADAKVDLNPHQLDAALFAFKSPLSKGTILADEVGLGKTIEAGLIISQKWSERKRKILIITPANLRKQWAMEMADKFYLPAAILEAKTYKQLEKTGINPFSQKSLIICSYQFAAKYSELILAQKWDLAVIDESHRLRNVYKTENKIAKAIKTALLNVPKILLTATPLQNSLMELYGLVSVIDEYAFGDEKSFRSQYSRISSESTFTELKARLAPLCHRTLRRQVLEYIRYTNRIPLTEEFYPTDDEVKLYDLVSNYLQKELLYALPNSQRQLITLILRKLLASSTFAIAGALESLIKRLNKILKEAIIEEGLEEIENDLDVEYEEEAEEWGEESDTATLSCKEKEQIEKEIEELNSYRELAVSITENSKGFALLSALSQGFSKALELGASQKAIVFTESRRTQDYLIKLLSDNGYAQKIVLFNGTNTDPLSKGIYQRWIDKNKNSDRIAGSKTADMRSALVDYFKETAQIMIATEAGAEGINLQFCSIVVNYDLPWNPQRIEQRIGRCHRYGQKHDVVVINFINRKNAADQRVYELLDQKFKLFSGVFGASDEVLGVIESGVDFEKRIAAIYQNCRNTEEIEEEFKRLQNEMECQITATMSDTRKKLLENFDADVHDRLKINLSVSRDYLNRYDSMLWELTKFSLKDCADFNEEKLQFSLNNSTKFKTPISNGVYSLSRVENELHRYRVGHPLAQEIISESKNRILSGSHIIFDYTSWAKKAENIIPYIGKSGILTLSLLSISGADEQDHLILCAKTEQEEILSEETIKRIFDLPVKEITTKDTKSTKELEDEVQKRKQTILSELSLIQSQWFEEEMEKLDFWAEDKRKALKGDLKDYDEQISTLKKEVRVATNLPDKLSIQKKLRDLDKKRNDAWKAYDDAAKEIETRKDALIDSVEERLKQTVEERKIFTIKWEIV